MERPTCKLCFRSFTNGRALGGHMRSHVAASAKAATQLIKSSSSSSSSFYEDHDVYGEGSGSVYGLRNNPKRSFRLADPEFSSPTLVPTNPAGSSIIVEDHEESETESESSRPPVSIRTITHRQRSKRARRSVQPEPEPVSSVSDTTTEEYVAISLMMLSRDTLTKPDHFDYQFDEDDEDDQLMDNQLRTQPVKGRSKYQCGTCMKVFRSYQALGGHRASHKKTNGCLPPNPKTQIHEEDVTALSNVEKIRHECPVCHRVFSSGQALGGHKRSHLSNTATATTAMTSYSMVDQGKSTTAVANGSRKLRESLIDLNLPAPLEEYAELSAVSDAEFVMVRSSSN